MKQPMIDYGQKPINDMLFTPYGSIFPLIKYLPEKGRVWECTDFGKSRISEILKGNDYKVKSTDILTGFDFLKETATFKFDMIITNPPYSLKDKFISKCYEYGKPWALLLPLTALEGTARGDMYRKFGISCIIFDKRADFTGKGTNWFNSSWFLWNMPIGNNKIIFEKLIAEKEISKKEKRKNPHNNSKRDN